MANTKRAPAKRKKASPDPKPSHGQLKHIPLSRIVYGKVKDLLEKPLEPPAVIIIPGGMHFVEKEFLESLVDLGSSKR